MVTRPGALPLQESEDAVKALAKEKDLLEREKWELRRQAKEATDHATALRSQLDLKDNRMKELEAELAMVRPPSPTLPPPTRGWG